MRAIVLGATGAVGSALVRELLASPRFEAVTILVRRDVDPFPDAEGRVKLVRRPFQMESLEPAAREAGAGCDAAFSTMGIGEPSKVSHEEFVKVDLEGNSAFGRGCRAAGVAHLSLLGSVGSDPTSRSKYLRAKGTLEENLRALAFPRVSFFRPSVLVTKQIRYGLKDRVTQTAFPVIARLLPARFHQIPVEDLARAMRINAESPAAAQPPVVEVLTYPDFVRLAAR